MSLVFIGDIHQLWSFVDRGLAALPQKPKAAVLLGDIQCDRPLDTVAAPLLDRGIAVHWIHGNHDSDGGPEMWRNLVSPDRNPRTAAGALHGRVRTIDGLRVAGLGGTFRPRVWLPPAIPRLHGRAELAADMETLGAAYGGIQKQALAQSLSTMAIWPEDVAALAAHRADVLVTHEAPSSHPAGNAALEALARTMGARWIVHGHHHVATLAEAGDGLRVLSIPAAWGMALDGTVLWEGEKQRPLPSPATGWRYQSIAA